MDPEDEEIDLPLQGDELELDDLETMEEGGEGQLYEHFRFVAPAGQELLRVDKFLANLLPKSSSRNRIQQAADAGCILVNGRAVKQSYRVKPSDVVSVVMGRPRYSLEITPENIPLDIVYEDDDLLVVNKPAGLVVHPGHGNWSGTLVNALAWHLRDTPGYDANDPRLGLVHRIDKDTSGLLVVAKTPDAKTHLGRQFFNKTTQREYLAMTWGIPEPARGTIATNLGRNPKDRLQVTTFPLDGPDGKRAVTHYEVVEPLGYVALVRCRLETGRTHQIRAHMRSIGHPLLNDARYGGDQVLRGTTAASYRQFVRHGFEECPRQALHARTLGFQHPRTAEQMFFEAPLPADFQALLDRWRHYSPS